MKRLTPSQQFKIPHLSFKHRSGIHVITTEAQTFDQALDIIKRKEERNKRAETFKKNEPSFRLQIAVAKMVAANKPVTLSTGVIKSKNTKMLESRRTRRSHPFRDLPEEQKPVRARQMYESKSFGIGARAGRQMAQLFGVSLEVMSEWLGIEIWRASEFNVRMVSRK